LCLQGTIDFRDDRLPGQASFSLDNCVAGLDGDFLQVRPLSMPAASKSVLDFSIEHLSARLSGSFLRFVGPVSVDVPAVECRVRNSIVSSTDASPLVVSDVAIAAEDARRMLVWKGERNFFDAIAVFWSLEASDDALTWEDWQSLWQTNGNVGSKNLPIDWLLAPPYNSEETIGRLTPEVWQLGPGLTELNPAIQGSTDGSDAGADLAELPLITQKIPAVSDPSKAAANQEKDSSTEPLQTSPGTEETRTPSSGSREIRTAPE
jgi:hypothetical protein